jgi:hypothetical protein
MGVKKPVKRAFLVGVTDYGNPTHGDLPFCKDDVAALAGVLQRKGFDCQDWIDKPLSDLLPCGELARFYKDAKSAEDTILFYFSGHGVDVAGEQILRGPGVKLSALKQGLFEGNLLLLSGVLDELSNFPAQKIVIVDACRVPEPGDGIAETVQKARRLALERLTNCAVIYASADGKKSFATPENKASRFTLSLTQELKKYGRGVLPTVESAIELVAAYKDGKSQTPWIYASLRDRPIDGFRIEETRLDGMQFSAHLGAAGNGDVWAVMSGSSAVAKFQAGAFVNRARLPVALSRSMRSYHPHPDANRHVFVKSEGTGVHQVTVSPAAAAWHKSEVETKKWDVKGMERVFGACWSPEGDFLAAFGAPRTGNLGAAIWSSASIKIKREQISRLPDDLEINAAAWISETKLLVAGAAHKSATSNVFLLERTGKEWIAHFFWKSSDSLRVTSMLVAKDKQHVYIGADDGSVAVGILSESNQPVFVAREHPASGFKSLAVMPWTGASRHEDYVEIGVCSMALDEQTKILGLTYFDGTAAFWDVDLRSYVKSFALSRGARRPRIVSVEPGSFLCQDGEKGRVFKVVEN